MTARNGAAKRASGVACERCWAVGLQELTKFVFVISCICKLCQQMCYAMLNITIFFDIYLPLFSDNSSSMSSQKSLWGMPAPAAISCRAVWRMA